MEEEGCGLWMEALRGWVVVVGGPVGAVIDSGVVRRRKGKAAVNSGTHAYLYIYTSEFLHIMLMVHVFWDTTITY